MARPFEGIRVLDVTHVLAGPFCTYQLALLGADVIKIEPPHSPDCARGRGPDDRLNAAGLGLNYQVQGSNKRAIALDLRTGAGREIALQLVDGADVLVENYRSGALAALGLGAAELRQRRPALVYCSLTGFGRTGDRASRNAYDNVVQAASGMMRQSADPEGAPHKAGASVVDYATGMNAAFAIAAALLRRERDGVGETIDCAMLDSALMMMAPELSAVLHEAPKSERSSEAGLGCYVTADEPIMLGAFTPRQNRRLWEALGEPELGAPSDWPQLWAKSAALRARLTEIMPTRGAAEWEAFFATIGVPAERVRSLEEAARMPHLATRAFVSQLPNPTAPAAPVHVPLAAFRYEADGPAIDRPPPAIGEHTREVLRELSFSDERIDELYGEGVVA